MQRVFDRKISDTTVKGYDADEFKKLLSDVSEVDRFRYYYYPPGSKFIRESRDLKKQQPIEVLSFLNGHFFPDSPDFFVEIQKKVYKSGKYEIILREVITSGEITKIAVLDFKKPRL